MQLNALTIVARIKPTDCAALDDLLRQIGGDIVGNEHIDFTQLKTTHFLRWVIINGDDRYPPQLAFESNFDGTLDQHLDEIVRTAGKALNDIYGRCEDYPASARTDPAQLKAFLRVHAIPYGAFYRGYPGMTVAEIQENTQTFACVQTFLDQNRARLLSLRALEVRDEIIAHLNSAGKAGGPPTQPSPSIVDRLTRVVFESTAAKVLLGLVALPLILAVLPLLVLWVCILLIHERIDQSDSKVADEVNPDLVRQEDYKVQNQLTHLVEVKPGLFRLLTLKIVLGAIDFLARHYYNRGQLGGIPSIHFARWAFIDNHKRLLFFSNYDGSWENYLGDFIDRAAKGLTGVWSNTKGFPPAHLLAFKGATNEDAFKQWARNRQIRTQVWYSAHAQESVQNILNNAAVRIAMRDQSAPSESDAAKWLARF